MAHQHRKFASQCSSRRAFSSGSFKVCVEATDAEGGRLAGLVLVTNLEAGVALNSLPKGRWGAGLAVAKQGVCFVTAALTAGAAGRSHWVVVPSAGATLPTTGTAFGIYEANPWKIAEFST
eukprot:16443153-Heterocapsa_arctica.AAC.1